MPDETRSADPLNLLNLRNPTLTFPEVAALRDQTRGLTDDTIFLNSAGASLQPAVVVDRVLAHLRLEEEIGGYEAADAAAGELARVYASVARLIGAEAGEIALMESATRAWTAAFTALHFSPGDTIVVGANEYASNYLPLLQLARRQGVEIVVAAALPTGEIDVEQLDRTLASRPVKLLALTHIATSNGMVQPAARVGQVARRHGVPYLLDACQSVGHMHVDVAELGCDMLSATGRKYMRAPRGTGFLYVRQGFLPQLEPEAVDMRGATWTTLDSYTLNPDATRFEYWESNPALRLGLGVAAEYALAIGLKRAEARIFDLASRLRSMLQEAPGVTVCDTGLRQSGIVTWKHERLSAARIVAELARHGIAARKTVPSSSLLDMEARGLGELVRTSVHYFNSREEMERTVQAVQQIVAG